MKQSKRYRAFQTAYHSHFVAMEDDMNRRLTDEEVTDEARHLLECLPYSCKWDELDSKERAKLKRQLKALAAE